MKIEMSKARNMLCALWFIGGGMIFAIFFLQTILGRFENVVDEAWSWLLPNLLPTFSLILSVFLYEIQASYKNEALVATNGKKIEKTIYRVSLYLSLAYLLALMCIIFSFNESSDKIITEHYQSFNVLLSPFQGLVTAAVGIVYYSAE